MKKKLFHIAFVICIATMCGCTAELPEVVKNADNFVSQTIPEEHLAIIEKLGFKTDEIVETENYFMVEGDIMISKERLEEIENEPETRQTYYGSHRLVSETKVRNISIAMDYYNNQPNNASGMAMATCAGQLDGAIAAFNNLPNCAVKITKTNYNNNPDILIQIGSFNWNSVVHQEIMCASEIPNGSYPGQFIFVNAEPYPTNWAGDWKWSSISTAKVKTSLIHAIGHCVGLGHTNDNNSGAFDIGFGESDNVEWIPGSLIGRDSQSIMNYTEHTYQNTIRSFSDGDKDALAILYPLFNISGPDEGQAGTELTFHVNDSYTDNSLSANNGYTFEWTTSNSSGQVKGYGNPFKVTYTTEGRKTIELKVTYNSKVHTLTHVVDISPVDFEAVITGPGAPLGNTYVKYNFQTPPAGVTFTGWTVTPKTYIMESDPDDRILSILFNGDRMSNNGNLYTVTANFTLPDGKTYKATRTINPFPGIPTPEISTEEIPAHYAILFNCPYDSGIQNNNTVGFQWEINGTLIDVGVSYYYVGASSLGFSVAGIAFPAITQPTQMNIRCRVKLTDGSITAWSDMATEMLYPFETAITGPGMPNDNVYVKYSFPTPPTGVTFTGWTVTPKTYIMESDPDDRVLSILFSMNNRLYTVTANFTLPDGTPYRATKNIGPYPAGLLTPEISTEEIPAHYAILFNCPYNTNSAYIGIAGFRWEINGTLVETVGSSPYYIGASSLGFSVAGVAFPAITQPTQMNIRCRVKLTDGSITAWSDMATGMLYPAD